jgi:G:T-mismatch repair DNA endonuclease (very short patch repair protein)
MVKCKFCSKETDNKSFCGNDCRYKWQSINWKSEKSPLYKQTEVHCALCKTIIRKNPYNITHIKHICCSRDCANKLKSILNRGENNPNFNTRWNEKQRQFNRDLTIKQLRDGKIPRQDTIPERLVESKLKERDILYIKQFPYKLGVADFYLPSMNTIIEVYGDYWHNLTKAKVRDERKNNYLKENGFDVKILWEYEVKENLDECLKWLPQ